MQLRRILAAALVTLFLCASLRAHPGSGIAVADDGTIYFADVGRRTIWLYSPDGKLTPVLRNHWTHDLKLTSDGLLYFEREGDANGSAAPRSLSRIKPGEKPELLIDYTLDFASFAGEPFTIDDEGNIYFSHMVRDVDDKWRALIRKRTPEGKVTTLAGVLDGPLYQDGAGDKASFRIISGMATGPGGAIYVLDRDHVRKISKTGEVTTITSGIIDQKPSDPPETRGPPTTINRLYGLCVTEDGDVYVAYHAGRRVIRVAADGKTDVAYRSPNNWAPIGVAHRNGMIYVLDSRDGGGKNGGPRVRVVRPDGTIETVVTVTE